MYEMKPEYYIGIDMIDEEHKQLFKYADEAYELLHDEFTPDKYDRIDIILENLRNYTVKHFSDEEQYMESINYKKIFTQKVQHQDGGGDRRLPLDEGDADAALRPLS